MYPSSGTPGQLPPKSRIVTKPSRNANGDPTAEAEAWANFLKNSFIGNYRDTRKYQRVRQSVQGCPHFHGSGTCRYCGTRRPSADAVRGLLLVLIASRLDKKARQSLDDDSLLPVVELLPQVRLRNRDVVEVQNQLRRCSPGLPPILLAARQTGAREHRRGREDAAGHPASRRAQEPAARRRQAYSLSSRRGSATCCRRACAVIC